MSGVRGVPASLAFSAGFKQPDTSSPMCEASCEVDLSFELISISTQDSKLALPLAMSNAHPPEADLSQDGAFQTSLAAEPMVFPHEVWFADLHAGGGRGRGRGGAGRMGRAGRRTNWATPARGYGQSHWQ